MNRGAILAAGLAAVVFAGTVDAGFLEYDDPHFILEPEVVHAPSARSVWATLSGPVWGSYHPLHILSYSVDQAIWGMARPSGFHATNVALFSLCAALVVLVARSYGLGPRAATLAGVLFAVHPCHVESVAWLAARKDLLSGAFLLLALLARRRPLACFAFFVLALASKTTAYLLPPFLLVEAWLEGRLDRETVLRSVPFLLLAALWLVINGEAQNAAGFAKPGRPGLERVTLVISSLGWYPRELVFPHPLSPHPTLDESWARGAMVLTLVVLSCLASRRVALATAFASLALAPVSNLIPLSNSVQDRYLFLPSVAAACVAGELLARRRWLVWIVALAAGLLAFETSRYARAWRTDGDLWRAAVAAEPSAAFARVALATAFHRRGELDAATREAELGAALDGGDLARAELTSLVIDRARRGEVAKAREVARSIAERWPATTNAHRARAYVAMAEKDLVVAERELHAAGDAPVEDWLTLAANEAHLGRRDQAREALDRALEIDPRTKQRVAGDPLLGPLLH